MRQTYRASFADDWRHLLRALRGIGRRSRGAMALSVLPAWRAFAPAATPEIWDFMPLTCETILGNIFSGTKDSCFARV